MRFEFTQGGLDPVLQSYVDDRSFVSLITGPLGSGKSYGSIIKSFNIMCEQEPNQLGVRKTRGYVVRNTYSDLLSTIWKDYDEVLGEIGKQRLGGSAPPQMTFNFKLPDKTTVLAEVIFLALDRPQAIKKLRGAQLTWGCLSEVKELDKSILDMLTLRIGRYPSKIDGGATFYGIIGDTNQCDEDHWLYELQEETKPSGYAFFQQPGGLLRETTPDEHGLERPTGRWLLNPLAENVRNLPDNYYINGAEGKDETWIAVNLANEYGVVMEGRPIYGEQWSDALHATDAIQVIPDYPIAIGMDFGLTPAAVITQETPSGRIHVLEEVIATGMGIKQFVKHALLPALNARYKSCYWNFVGDPAGNRRADTDEQTVFKELADLGIECEAANTNDPGIRFEAVRGFLTSLVDGRPAFLLHKRCGVLRKGFNSGYHFRRLQVVGEKRYVDKPNKNKYSHPHDALQYVCMYYNGDTVVTVPFNRNKFNRAVL